MLTTDNSGQAGERRRRRHRYRLLIITLVAAALAAIGAAAAASTLTGEVQTYTGCLTKGGELVKVAEGGSPLSPCSSKQKRVDLSGGDITAVTAGTGLAGGAASGAANVEVAPTYRLPQQCEDGDLPKWHEGAWACASDTNILVSAQLNPIGVPPSNLIQTEVVSLEVPAGIYAITAIGRMTGPLADSDLGCVLHDGTRNLAFSAGHGHPSQNSDSLALFTLSDFAVPTTITVRCGTNDPGVHAHNFGLEAVSQD
jgi:hypothetical protein